MGSVTTKACRQFSHMIAATLQKGTGSLIVKGGNPLVLLQLGNEVLNQVSPAILISVALSGLLLIGLRWKCGCVAGSSKEDVQTQDPHHGRGPESR